MKQNQPQLPFVPGPIDFSQPVQFRFSQLQTVHTAAARAGWRMVRLKVLAGTYEAAFVLDARLTQGAAKDDVSANVVTRPGIVGTMV